MRSFVNIRDSRQDSSRSCWTKPTSLYIVISNESLFNVASLVRQSVATVLKRSITELIIIIITKE